MGALFLHLKPYEYLKKQYKTKKLVEKTSFSLQAENLFPRKQVLFLYEAGCSSDVSSFRLNIVK
nr:hypothetical protein P5626_05985 [Bacillus subtilis]WGD81350.1 hypothetical protein P5659_20805 [Bacillus subtilis]WGD83388.1 hypothetical protein P5664_16850 [Bacillus subtilis]WGD96287.1 hypothetical protein P5642_10200 [Bacillus subtilis]